MESPCFNLPHTMIAWDSCHYLTTLNSIEVAKPMVAECAIVKELWVVLELLSSFLQRHPVDVVKTVLEVDLDWGGHLSIVTTCKGLKMITSWDRGMVGNLYMHQLG